MLEDWASRPSPWRSRASTADLVVTVSLFVATALAGIAAVVIGWVFAALSQYSCDWETSTRPCTPWVTWVPSLVESIVLVAVFVGVRSWPPEFGGRGRRDGRSLSAPRP